MAKDYFAELKKQPYPLFVAPRPYSFDLNEDMLRIIREEFGAEGTATKLAAAIKGKAKGEIEKAGKQFFEEFGQNWINRVMQLGEEYPDRTIEVVLESVDPDGNQFLVFPHVPQRYMEIAYLATQQFLKLPVILNNQYSFAYRVPQCYLFNQIKEKCGDAVAKLMTCQHGCLKALETISKNMKLLAIIEMTATTAKEGYCEFSMKNIGFQK